MKEKRLDKGVRKEGHLHLEDTLQPDWDLGSDR